MSKAGAPAEPPTEEAALAPAERRFLLLLGLPALGLALAITTVVTYLPVLIAELTGPALTGVLIGTEGLMALFVPVLVGSRSDRAGGRLGRRKTYLVAAAPLACVALVLMPLSASLPVLALLLLAFYAAYFAYYAPYRALYPDLVEESRRGRSQGYQNTLREVGLGLALVGGGVLLGLWRPLPFLIAAAVLATVTTVVTRRVSEPDPAERPSGGNEDRSSFGEAWTLLRNRAGVRWLIAGIALWELALAALKTFVVLFITVGLGMPVAYSSLVLAVVAGAVIAAALTGGALADRFGYSRLMRPALWVYGILVLVPFFVHSAWALVAVPLAAFGAGIVMTLPFSVLMGMMPEEGRGAASGLFEFGRGVGVLLGPIAAGVAITVFAPVLDSTEGYAALFPVAAAAILGSIPVFGRIERAEGA